MPLLPRTHMTEVGLGATNSTPSGLVQTIFQLSLTIFLVARPSSLIGQNNHDHRCKLDAHLSPACGLRRQNYSMSSVLEWLTEPKSSLVVLRNSVQRNGKKYRHCVLFSGTLLSK